MSSKKARRNKLEAQYTVSEGSKTPARKLPRWRFRHHDIIEYLEMLEEDHSSGDETSQAG